MRTWDAARGLARTRDVFRVVIVAVGTGVLLAGCGGTAVSTPHFRATSGWHVGWRTARAFDVRHTHGVRAFGWAATVPCRDCTADLPLRTLTTLPAGGVVIKLVNFRVGDTRPPQRTWPPRIRTSDVELTHAALTGRPLFLAMRAGRTGSIDWNFLVWFGRAHPMATQLARANEELRSLGP
jgi:di/tricarboxylate transporter